MVTQRRPVWIAQRATAFRGGIGLGPSLRAVQGVATPPNGHPRGTPEPGGARIGRLFPLALFLLSALLVTACGDGDTELPTPVTPAPTPAPPELTGSIPREIGRLDNLMFLKVDQNRLTGPLPSEIGRLVRLERLQLGANELSGAVPPEIGN